MAATVAGPNLQNPLIAQLRWRRRFFDCSLKALTKSTRNRLSASSRINHSVIRLNRHKFPFLCCHDCPFHFEIAALIKSTLSGWPTISRHCSSATFWQRHVAALPPSARSRSQILHDRARVARVRNPAHHCPLPPDGGVDKFIHALSKRFCNPPSGKSKRSAAC